MPSSSGSIPSGSTTTTSTSTCPKGRPQGWTVGGNHDDRSTVLVDHQPSDGSEPGDDRRAHPERKVMPIGGLKEKILAAKRNKIKEIIIPQFNKRDLDELEDEVKKGVVFHSVATIEGPPPCLPRGCEAKAQTVPSFPRDFSIQPRRSSQSPKL